MRAIVYTFEMAYTTSAYKRYHTNIEIVKGQNALQLQEESLQAIEVVQARASGLGMGLKLYPSNMQRMRNKDPLDSSTAYLRQN